MAEAIESKKVIVVNAPYGWYSPKSLEGKEKTKPKATEQ